MLKYALYRNHLTEGENDFSAIPLSLTNKKIEDIIAQITKPGSILKQTECVAVIHDFFRAIKADGGHDVFFYEFVIGIAFNEKAVCNQAYVHT